MKTYNATNRISATAKKEIERILSTHDKYKSSYFFNPDTSANGRRRKETQFASSNPDVAFQTEKGLLQVSMSYSESCQNVYYSISITLDDKSKNITAVKNLLK